MGVQTADTQEFLLALASMINGCSYVCKLKSINWEIDLIIHRLQADFILIFCKYLASYSIRMDEEGHAKAHCSSGHTPHTHSTPLT